MFVASLTEETVAICQHVWSSIFGENYTAWLHEVLLTMLMEHRTVTNFSVLCHDKTLNQQCIAHSGSPHDDESSYYSNSFHYTICLTSTKCLHHFFLRLFHAAVNALYQFANVLGHTFQTVLINQVHLVPLLRKDRQITHNEMTGLYMYWHLGYRVHYWSYHHFLAVL